MRRSLVSKAYVVFIASMTFQALLQERIPMPIEKFMLQSVGFFAIGCCLLAILAFLYVDGCRKALIRCQGMNHPMAISHTVE